MQIVQQVRRLIAIGEMAEGEELPSIRSLAEQLVVNPNTVARAYRELESAGLVQFSRGMGTFVAPSEAPMNDATKKKLLVEKIDPVLIEARQMKLSLPEVIEIVKERDAALSAGDDAEVVHA